MVTWFSMGSQDKGEIAASSASGARTDGRAQAKQCRGAPASHQRTNAVDEMPKVRTRTVKLMEENTGVNFRDLGLGSSFLGMTTKAQQQKKKINWT